jgi:hypothetical protein
VTVLLSAGLTAGLAVVLAVAGMAGGWIVTAAAGLGVLALAIGWGDLLRLPHRSGTAVLIGAIGIGSLVAGTYAFAPDSGVDEPLGVFVAVLAAAVLCSFAHELLRQDGRHDLVESVTGTLSGQVVAVLGSGWVLLVHTDAGWLAVLVAAAAIAAARLGAALPIPVPEQFRPWIGVGFGLLGALGASFAGSGVRPVTAVVAGVAVGGVGVAIDRLFPWRESVLDLAMVARAAAPVAAAGTVAYAVLRIGVG